MNTQNALATAQPCTDGDEINLLELLVVIAENLKLLILGPLIAAAIAWGIASYQISPVYESISVIIAPQRSNPQVIARLAQSADTLAAVSKALGIPANASAAVGRQDNLITLTTYSATAEQAQALNNAIWVQVFAQTQQPTDKAQQLQTRLKILQESLAASSTLEQATAKQLASGQITEATARLYSDIQNATAQRIRDIADLEAELSGLSSNNLIQQATLSTAPSKPKKTLITAVTFLATGMALLIFVFTRQAMRNANHNPQQAQSLGRLRAALGLNAASDKPREDR